MRSYIALIHKEHDSDYGVSFPDLPGCVTAGKTIDEARDFAKEALDLHLQGMEEDGESPPEPSDLQVIMRDRENMDGVAVLVEGAVPTRTVRVNITMPSDILDRIDAFAERRGMNRSVFLVNAARREMERPEMIKPVRHDVDEQVNLILKPPPAP